MRMHRPVAYQSSVGECSPVVHVLAFRSICLKTGPSAFFGYKLWYKFTTHILYPDIKRALQHGLVKRRHMHRTIGGFHCPLAYRVLRNHP